MADRVYLLLDGRIADEGPPDKLLGPDSVHVGNRGLPIQAPSRKFNIASNAVTGPLEW